MLCWINNQIMKQHLRIGVSFFCCCYFSYSEASCAAPHSGVNVKWSNCNNYSIKKVCVCMMGGVFFFFFLKDGNAGGGAGCPQVPLIKGNLNSPPCSYLRTGACLSSVAGWCNELHSRTLNALQDSPCRAIMSTPAHQFRLPEPPFHKYGAGMSCPPKTLRGSSVYFIGHLEVTWSLWTSVQCPWARGARDGPEPGHAWHQSTYVRAVGFGPGRRIKGRGKYWVGALGEERGHLKASGGLEKGK